MGIGAGILLIAVGAILTFAVHWHLAGIDLQAVGWVLMSVGVLGLILYFAFWNRQRPTAVAPVTERRTVTEAPVTERRVVTEGPVTRAPIVTETPVYQERTPPPPPAP
jgi:hypothetical protein